MRQTLELVRVSWHFMAGVLVKWRSAGNYAGEISVAEDQSKLTLLIPRTLPP